MTIVLISSPSDDPEDRGSTAKTVTLDTGAIRVAGADLRIVPEITVKGLKKQMRQRRAELRAGMLGLSPEEFENRWSLVFDRIEDWETPGPDPHPDKATAFREYDKLKAAGHDLQDKATVRRLKIKSTQAGRFNVDPRTIGRWLDDYLGQRG